MSPRPLICRGRTRAHREAVMHLQRTCLPGDAPVDLGPGHLFWLAYAGPEPVGFVLFADGGTDILILERAGVLDTHAGRGIYKRLLRAAERAMRRPCRLCTYTSASNYASANGLIGAGWRLYEPSYRWGWPDGFYLTKALK